VTTGVANRMILLVGLALTSKIIEGKILILPKLRLNFVQIQPNFPKSNQFCLKNFDSECGCIPNFYGTEYRCDVVHLDTNSRKPVGWLREDD